MAGAFYGILLGLRAVGILLGELMRLLLIAGCLLLLCATGALAEEVGVVVLEDTPGCDFFVVETAMGYSLLEWYGGQISVWEGDRVFGDLHSYGFTDIFVEGRDTMRVWVEDYWVGERKALGYFYSNCD